MARTRKSLPEAMRIVIGDLTWVLSQAKKGRAGEQEIEDLSRCIWRIRGMTPVTSDEENVVRRYREAREAERKASDELGAFFMPLVKAATTEKEARALFDRMPNDPCLKAFAMDHFCYRSKVIPLKDRPGA